MPSGHTHANTKIWHQINTDASLLLIAGPCVIEDESTTLEIARSLKAMNRDRAIQFVFKASFDKANRTSLSSYRGPGLDKGLAILSRVATEVGLPVISAPRIISQPETQPLLSA